MPSVQHLRVTEAESGQKLLQFLNRRLEGQIPRSALMRWIRTGQVRVDKSRCKPFDTLQAGQTVRVPPCSVEPEAPIDDSLQGNPFRLARVHEDDSLLVLAKPPNLPSQPGTGQTDSIVHRLKQAYADRAWMPTLVHRLDKETSGLLLVAKTYGSLRHLQTLWQGGQVCKVYLAWVLGQTPWSGWSQIRDSLEQTIRRGKNTRPVSRRVTAVSMVRTIRRQSSASLVAVRLVTGRKHQIRLQMAQRGHPVLGDSKYGQSRAGQGLLLHACYLAWENRAFRLAPSWLDEYAVSQEELETCLADLPPDPA
jgi:23S rRNA pseudouridine955/2504/2580 synthase